MRHPNMGIWTIWGPKGGHNGYPIMEGLWRGMDTMGSLLHGCSPCNQDTMGAGVSKGVPQKGVIMEH